MADYAHAQESGQSTLPLTEDGFVADRQRFWMAFTRLVVIGAASVIVLLVLMAIFLL